MNIIYTLFCFIVCKQIICLIEANSLNELNIQALAIDTQMM